MNKLYSIALALFIFGGAGQIQAQNKLKKVLFIGNSYTYYNSMPDIMKSMCESTGDTLIHDQHTPGGSSLSAHANNSTVATKITSNNWDNVVLQDQSQRPAFQQSYVEANVFPFAKKLDGMIDSLSTCAKTTFYMTWGRKNGDAGNCTNFPPVCTYRGMDSMLKMRYTQMAKDNKAVVAPVSVVWRYLRENHPEIELYDPDESHPSVAGSYAAACCFYTTVYKKDPTKITFDHTLKSANAIAIRNACKLMVYDSLQKWNFLENDLSADFSISQKQGFQVEFWNNSTNAKYFTWTIDGKNYNETNPTHTFSDTGSYKIRLTTKNDCDVVSIERTIHVKEVASISMPEAHELGLRPNPTTGIVKLSRISSGELTIYDMFGREVFQEILVSADQLDLSDLQQGSYFVVVREGNRMNSQKVIVLQSE
jgi:hypothetical protein